MADKDTNRYQSGSIENFDGPGAQRLSLERLKEYQSWKYGMFIHYGMSTFGTDIYGGGLPSNEPLTIYNPTNLNVDQWIKTAKDAGMQYVVLTAKHMTGFALWPTKAGKYSVANCKDKTDVVNEFVKACRKYEIKPCLYYNAWDNTNLFGMPPVPTRAVMEQGWTHTNKAYREFMYKQVKELLTNYGKIEMLWIDIPHVLGIDEKQQFYDYVKSLDPEIIMAYNHSCQNGGKLDSTIFWPTDIMTMERTMPNQSSGHEPLSYYNWKNIRGDVYYIPGEYNDTLGREWFWLDADKPRNRYDLISMVTGPVSRGVNTLINVSPDPTGNIPKQWTDTLQQLKKDLLAIDFFKNNDLDIK